MLENGRYARAAALAIPSLEENFKKLALLVHPLIRDVPQRRKEFWNACRTHKVKSGTPATLRFLLGEIDEAERAELLTRPSLRRAKAISPTRHDMDVWGTFFLSYRRLDPDDEPQAAAVGLLARAARLAQVSRHVTIRPLAGISRHTL